MSKESFLLEKSIFFKKKGLYEKFSVEQLLSRVFTRWNFAFFAPNASH
jgi:hypothetical protein